MFQSTPPVWEATPCRQPDRWAQAVSIHASRVGGDAHPPGTQSWNGCFNPRLPCGRRPVSGERLLMHRQFQSTPPVWEATLGRGNYRVGTQCFNPRLPCGRRLLVFSFANHSSVFQSTPPVWEATKPGTSSSQSTQSFNPRLPCGRRLLLSANKGGTNKVSIHASRVGGDSEWVRAATSRLVSIHASRVGGDSFGFGQRPAFRRFNPRLPCGRRLTQTGRRNIRTAFQSTPPVWEATQVGGQAGYFRGVSIHASRVGGDHQRGQWCVQANVSIHASRVGGDGVSYLWGWG